MSYRAFAATWDYFRSDLQQLDMLVSIIIIANLTALYNPSAHSVRRIWHCPPFVGKMSNALAVESRVLRHSLQHCHRQSGQIQPEKDHWLREQNKPSEFWDTEAMFHDKSSGPETVSYCSCSIYALDLSSQHLRLGSFALRSGPCQADTFGEWKELVSISWTFGSPSSI